MCTSTVQLTIADQLPSTKSVQSAQLSVYAVPTSKVIVQLPFSVITGEPVSTIFTVLVTVAATFPFASV